MEENSDSEIYIIWGCDESTFFVTHYIAREDLFEDGISSQVYDAMMQFGMIVNPAERLVICDTRDDVHINMICVSHAQNIDLSPPSIEDVDKKLTALVKSTPDNLYMIKYSYTDKGYILGSSPGGDLKEYINSNIDTTILGNSQTVSQICIVTSKPFPQ